MAPSFFSSRGLTTGNPIVQRADDGYTSMVPITRAVVIIVTSLSFIVCSARLYIRKFIRKAFGVDDYLVIIALICLMLWGALAVTISYYGLGRRQEKVDPRDLLVFLKIYYVALCTYLFVGCLVKASLTVFIMRIFPQEYVLKTGYGLLAFLVVFCLTGELSLVFQCKPFKAGFDKTIQPSECYSPDTMYKMLLYQGVLMFVLDVFIIILPMPSLWALHLPLKRRLMLMGLFSFGFVACIASVVRFGTLVFTKDTQDYTYSAASSLIWMSLEYNLALIAGSLSSLRPLFRWDKFFTTQNSKSGSGIPSRQSQNNSSGKGFELDSGKRWRGRGILKTNEVSTTVGSVSADTKSESQERIVPNWDKLANKNNKA